MLGRTYTAENCSIARTLEVVGERWSLLILRDALFRGMTRYSEFQESLGIASNVLADRLEGFVRAGLFEQVVGVRGQYRPTSKARDLVPTLLALTAWGDAWAAAAGPPVIYRDEDGHRVSLELHDENGTVLVSGATIVAHPGPGARTARGTGRSSPVAGAGGSPSK